MKLHTDEREVLLNYNDADKVWTVYSDSRTMRGMVLRLAKRLGVEPRKVGDHGIEFSIPGRSLRLATRRARRPKNPPQ